VPAFDKIKAMKILPERERDDGDVVGHVANGCGIMVGAMERMAVCVGHFPRFFAGAKRLYPDSVQPVVEMAGKHESGVDPFALAGV
jgi:hypothetical protein